MTTPLPPQPVSEEEMEKLCNHFASIGWKDGIDSVSITRNQAYDAITYIRNLEDSVTSLRSRLSQKEEECRRYREALFGGEEGKKINHIKQNYPPCEHSPKAFNSGCCLKCYNRYATRRRRAKKALSPSQQSNE